MAMPAPPQGGPTPEQMQQMQAAMAAEARKRGMTPQEFQAQQRAQIEAEAKANGMSVPQYIQKLRTEAIANHQRMQQQQAQQAAQQGQQGGVQQMGQKSQVVPGGQAPAQQQQQVPINNTGTPDPRALAVMKWLRGQDLKTRTCILNGQRKDMFRVKRALRALDSPAYATAAAHPKSQLPARTESFPATEIFKLLPLSLLALRVSKAGDTPAPSTGGAGGKPKKRAKGLWTVRIEQQQDVRPELHYAFLADAPSWKMRLYAVGALVGVLAVVLFPLWPLTLRLGVWYASMGLLGLLAAFFGMAIVRLIVFVATVFTVPPGLWIYPNLFEDVGFLDSFRPMWGWHETAEDKKAARKAKREARKAKAEAKAKKAAEKAGSAGADGEGEDGHAEHGHDHDHDHDDDHEDVEEEGEEEEEEEEDGIPSTITVAAGKATGADAGAGDAVKRAMKASVEEGSDTD